jgi:hypothetical protein
MSVRVDIGGKEYEWVNDWLMGMKVVVCEHKDALVLAKL